MEKNWVKIFTSTNYFRAEMVKHVLTEHRIAAVMMNKQDSSHRTFGHIDVYIHQENFSHAIEIMILNEINSPS